MHVAVLAGGRSPEHEVSLASTAQVLEHLDRSRWQVWPVYLDRDGGWWPSARPLPRGGTWTPGTAAASSRAMRPGAAVGWLLDHGIQIVLPVLHGPFGEDGTVQGMLELHDLPCVGSGCAASAVAMDKIRTRETLQAAGVPLARAYESAIAFARADAALEPGYVGIRPKIVPEGAPGSDFVVQGPETHGAPGLVNLFGIESPGLTACLALADEVLDRLCVAAPLTVTPRGGA